MSFIKKAVFPVAGLGTRFLPVTKSIPKEMLPILNKPLIQYAIEEALAAGIESILLVNGRGKNAIEDYFDHAIEVENALMQAGKTDVLSALVQLVPQAGRFAFVRQTRTLGLGHAVLCAKEWVQGEPFAVVLPDDVVMADTPCIKQLMEAYDMSMGNMSAIVDVPRDETHRYGILSVAHEEGPLLRAQGVVEKPAPDVAPSTKAIMGRYILHPDIFNVLEHQPAGVGGEIQLTDALAAMIGTHGLHGLTIDGSRFDCGTVEGMVAAQIAFGLQHPEVGPKLRSFINQVM